MDCLSGLLSKLKLSFARDLQLYQMHAIVVDDTRDADPDDAYLVLEAVPSNSRRIFAARKFARRVDLCSRGPDH